jgi:hypothetical protein
MSTDSPSTGSTGSPYPVVGYDGSPPDTRALDAAASLLRGRDGSTSQLRDAHPGDNVALAWAAPVPAVIAL